MELSGFRFCEVLSIKIKYEDRSRDCKYYRAFCSIKTLAVQYYSNIETQKSRSTIANKYSYHEECSQSFKVSLLFHFLSKWKN